MLACSKARSGRDHDPRKTFKFTLKKDHTFGGRYGGIQRSSLYNPSRCLHHNVPAATISFGIFLSHSKTSLCPLSMSLGFKDMHQSIVATCNERFIKQEKKN